MDQDPACSVFVMCCFVGFVLFFCLEEGAGLKGHVFSFIGQNMGLNVTNYLLILIVQDPQICFIWR